MPRYYFNVHDGVASPDQEGTELPSFEAARSEALMLAGEIIREAGRRGDAGEEWRIEVTDITGATLFLMSFVVMSLQPKPRQDSIVHSQPHVW